MPETIEVTKEDLEKLDANSRAAKEIIENARFRAIGESSPDRVFFTHCALQMVPIPSRRMLTMATDGVRLFYNPEFTLQLSQDEVHGVVCGHETAHCFMDHFMRGSGYANKEMANIAMDLEINQILQEAGYVLPKIAVFPGKPPFESLPLKETFEVYYRLLHSMASQLPSGDDPGGCGGIIEPQDSAEAMEQSQRWREIAAAAAQAAAAVGTVSGALQRIIDKILKPKYDPWQHLEDYLTHTAKADKSWAKFNRRYLSRGMYLPGRFSMALGEMVILFDLSGSITEDQARMMAWVMATAMERMPGKLTIMYHDVEVHKVQEWEPGDSELKFESTGGGGTSHIPAFEMIDNMGLEPELVIAVTDLYTEFPSHTPHKTLWLRTVEGNSTPPFGDVINLV